MNWKFWKREAEGHEEQVDEKKVCINGEDFKKEYLEKVMDEWRDCYIIN